MGTAHFRDATLVDCSDGPSTRPQRGPPRAAQPAAQLRDPARRRPPRAVGSADDACRVDQLAEPTAAGSLVTLVRLGALASLPSMGTARRTSSSTSATGERAPRRPARRATASAVRSRGTPRPALARFQPARRFGDDPGAAVTGSSRSRGVCTTTTTIVHPIECVDSEVPDHYRRDLRLVKSNCHAGICVWTSGSRAPRLPCTTHTSACRP